MGYWTMISRFVNIFVLLGLMISLIFYTMSILISKLALDADELYDEYKRASESTE